MYNGEMEKKNATEFLLTDRYMMNLMEVVQLTAIKLILWLYKFKQTFHFKEENPSTRSGYARKLLILILKEEYPISWWSGVPSSSADSFFHLDIFDEELVDSLVLAKLSFLV